MATDRYQYAGRPLSHWLQELVVEDSVRRQAAARLIIDWHWTPQNLETATREAWDETPQQFSGAVREVLREPGFPSAEFVRKLLLLDLGLQQSWSEQCQEEVAKEKGRDEQALSKLSEPPTEAELKRYVRRLCVQLHRDCKRISESAPHEVLTTGIAISNLIEILGTELLPAAGVLRMMLEYPAKAHIACNAIARMGNEGLVFYEDLITGIERGALSGHQTRALGGLLRYASARLPQFLAWAASPDQSTRLNAIAILGHCERECIKGSTDVELLLQRQLRSVRDETEWHALVRALGNIGDTVETVVLLLGFEPTTPERTASLIIALRFQTGHADTVVPWLLKKLDDFEEYDPDWTQHGEHERVITALRAFPSAECAQGLPTLMRHIWTKPQKFYVGDQPTEAPRPDEDVIKYLGELGPVAAPALLILHEALAQARREHSGQNTPDESPLVGLITAAIQQIQMIMFCD